MTDASVPDPPSSGGLQLDDPDLDQWERDTLAGLRRVYLERPPANAMARHLAALRDLDTVAARPAGTEPTTINAWRRPALALAAVVVLMVAGWALTVIGNPRTETFDPAVTPSSTIPRPVLPELVQSSQSLAPEQPEDGTIPPGSRVEPGAEEDGAVDLTDPDDAVAAPPLDDLVVELDDSRPAGDGPAATVDAGPSPGTASQGGGQSGPGASPSTSPGPAGGGVPASTAAPAGPAATANPSGATCRGLAATIVGTNQADRLVGTAGDDVIVGGNGADEIDGGGGDDVICGGNGRDVLYGGPGNDVLVGGNGKDELHGGPGDDELEDDGQDTLHPD